MKNKVYVQRDVALNQHTGDKWGIMSLIISCFALGTTTLVYLKTPEQEGTFQNLMLYWMSSIFIFLGLHQGYFGLRALYRQLSARFSNKAFSWKEDYPWKAGGAVYSSRKKLLAAYTKGVFFAFFLAPFVYLVFIREADTTALWVKLIAGVFVLVIILIIYSLRTAWYYHFLYGSSYLKRDQLPLQPGIPFSLELINPKLLRQHQSLEISIRFIQEVWVSSGSGKSRSSKLQFELLHDYRQTCEVNRGRLLISACLPADAPHNAMSSSQACYWELVVHNTADINFHPYLAWFFLPVYSLQEHAERAMA